MASRDGGRDDRAVPDTLDLLWGTAERPRRGPRPALTLEQVVEAAVAVADAEGLEAVTMQRTARELGYTTMSLYRYVSGKDQLVELMVDSAVGDPPDTAAVSGGWPEQVRVWARAFYRRRLDRPWLARAPVTGPPRGPRGVAWLEAIAGPLLRAGLSTGETLDTAAFLSASIHGLARMTGDLAGHAPQDAAAEYAAVLRRAASDGRYPVLASLGERGDLEDFGDEPFGDMASPLEFALDRLIEGIAAHRGGGGAEGPR
ncbi:TetR/AcrR family transcriptional regulator C-terminal domain-containing protein [Nocardiopsis baichengensis]|uniref:TetR/AcrR family transcriptional regulator C-terminal domain-containing protein n=1 Tax=Nocardiopsis baichengensis TaxID=280240 RepID=UPI000347B44A|nr:TetR/AcrR family transcriptional regulator C-terminal domain-containing protein [Nocardiopsis baichengensis]